MSAKLQHLVGAVVTLYAIAVTTSASGQIWTKLNDGTPVDAGEQVNTSILAFDAVRLPADDVVYLFQSKQAGLVMGRFAHADKSWQLWTPDGWSNAAGLLPSTVNHPIFKAVDLVVMPHPDDDDGLFGLNTTTLQTGSWEWDVHSFPTNFEFTDGIWRTWNGPGSLEALHARSVTRSWTRNEHADFVLGANSTGGLVGMHVGIVGALGPFNDQLTASRYDHGNRDWLRWSNTDADGWAVNDICFNKIDRCTDVFILGENVHSSGLQFDEPRVTYLPNQPNEQYLVTFRYAPINRNQLGACRYIGGSAPHWEWLSTNGWIEAAADNDYSAMREIVPEGGSHREQLYWAEAPGGPQVIILRALASGFLREIIYDVNSTSFAETPDDLASARATGNGNPSVNLSHFCTNIDSNGKLWLAYADGVFQDTIYVLTKQPGGNWINPFFGQSVFEAGANRITSPVGINFVGPDAEPVLFFVETNTTTNESRLYALGDPQSPLWSGQQTIAPDPKRDPVLLDNRQLEFVKAVEHDAPGGGTWGIGGLLPMGMAIDEEGYLYAGATGHFRVDVHAPNDTTIDSNVEWGHGVEILNFPSGAAIDTLRGKLYLARWVSDPDFIGVGNGSLLQIWDYRDYPVSGVSLRDAYVGWDGNGKGISDPEREWVDGYYPAEFNGDQLQGEPLRWAEDMAVDPTRGLLYVSHGFRHRIDVYGIQDNELLTDTNAFNDGLIGTGDVGATYPQQVNALRAGLIAAGYLVIAAGPQPRAHWAESDLEGVIIPHIQDEVNGLGTIWQDLASGSIDYRNAYLRSVRKEHKARHKLPRFLGSIGRFGGEPADSGTIGFNLPRGIDVDADGDLWVTDSENHRIMHIQMTITSNGVPRSFDAQPVGEIGSLGHDPGELYYPTEVAVDDRYGWVYVADPLNNRVEVFGRAGDFFFEWTEWAEEDGSTSLVNPTTVACDDAGGVYVGSSSTDSGDVLKFRVPPGDDGPRLLVTQPAPCDIISIGTNAVTGVAYENRHVAKIRVTVRVGSNEIATAELLDPPVEFALSWELTQDAIGVGTLGVLEVRATDVLRQTDVVEIPVVLGALTSADDPDGDLVPTSCDNCPYDANELQYDCDTNGWGDVCEIASGTAEDVNTDGVPDECVYDCNHNEIVDLAEILAGSAIDCNRDSIIDDCQERRIVYVKPRIILSLPSGPIGESWADAFGHPSTAFGAIKAMGLPLTDVWIASGTYRADAGTGDRQRTFQLPPCIHVYGGFEAGDEMEDRSSRFKQTIFSGDLLDNDGPDFANRSDNSFHVVTADWVDENALLDGIVVQGGNASDDPSYSSGGGMIIANDVRVRDCTFRDNQADNGGGVAVIEGQPQIHASSVVDNSAGANGGGIYIAPDAGARVESTLIARNTSGADGAGIHVRSDSVQVVNCTIVDNQASGLGGGAFVGEYGAPIIRNSILWGNWHKVPSEKNEDAQVMYEDGSTVPNVEYTCIEEISQLAAGTGNTGADPLFFDEFRPDEYVLSAASPVANAGTDAFTPESVDRGGHPRVVDGLVDLGAWEFVVCDHADDGVVCVDDVYYFIDACLEHAGPDLTASAECAGAFDQDGDDDVDLADYARFAACVGDQWSSATACAVRGQSQWMRSGQELEGGGILMVGGAGSEGGEWPSGNGEAGSGLTTDESPPGSGEDGGPSEPLLASLSIEVQPVGGGAALATLDTGTEYELHYVAGNDAINTFLVMSISSNAVVSVADADAATNGEWAAAGNFTLTDFSDDDPPVQAPGYAEGQYWYSLAMDGFWGDTGTAGDTGYLCRFTTGSAGELTLDVELIGDDSGEMVMMSATGSWTVE